MLSLLSLPLWSAVRSGMAICLWFVRQKVQMINSHPLRMIKTIKLKKLIGLPLATVSTPSTVLKSDLIIDLQTSSRFERKKWSRRGGQKRDYSVNEANAGLYEHRRPAPQTRLDGISGVSCILCTRHIKARGHSGSPYLRELAAVYLRYTRSL